MQLLHIAGYQFTSLTDLTTLRISLFNQCECLQLKGTILLSPEGMNLFLAGIKENIQTLQTHLRQMKPFANMRFHETIPETIPYQHLKVKIKNEIITFRQPDIDAVNQRATALAPLELKQWLDEKREVTLVDTRNDYEVAYGTFAGAVNLHLADFSQLPKAISALDRDKPMVLFCTGGIRCEKAALYLQNQGFSQVYQLDGGILGYFAQVGSTHYQGACFVFDERICVDSALTPASHRHPSPI